MRMLGTIEGQKKAENFVSHLLTLDVATHVEAAQGNPELWDIWIRDEDKLTLAKAELVAFLANPDSSRYTDAYKLAQDILLQKQKKAEVAVKNLHRGVPRSAINVGVPPMTTALVILCSVTTILANFNQPARDNTLGQLIVQQLSFLEANAERESPNHPFASLERGEIWRALTPIFLHGNPIHLLVNMVVLIQFGRAIEYREGSTRYGLMILAIAVFSNLLQGGMPKEYYGTPHFVGISGVVYGLFGFHWASPPFAPIFSPPSLPCS